MSASMRRITVGVVVAVLMSLGVAGVASANVTGKTLNTTPCDFHGNGTEDCAIYSDPDGFSGTITGDASSSATLVDFVCVHFTGGAQFVPVAGTYTFKVYDGNTLLGSTSETVASTPDCSGANNPVTSGGVSFTFPASGTVNYTVSITGINSGNVGSICPASPDCNSVRNQVFDTGNDSHVNSASVGVVGGPPVNVPEAPLAIMLVLSGGVVAVLYVRRQMRPAPAGSSGTP